MKKTIYFFPVLLIVLLLLANAIRPKILYPAGRDTVESFGDGTYQIFSGQTGEGLRKETLYNCKYDVVIIPQVELFQITNGKVYATGKSIEHYTYDGADIEYTYEHYAVIEIETNKLTLCMLPDSSTGADTYLNVYTRLLDEMIKNGDVQLLCQLTDFSNVDQSVFEKFGHFQ